MSNEKVHVEEFGIDMDASELEMLREWDLVKQPDAGAKLCVGSPCDGMGEVENWIESWRPEPWRDVLPSVAHGSVHWIRRMSDYDIVREQFEGEVRHTGLLSVDTESRMPCHFDYDPTDFERFTLLVSASGGGTVLLFDLDVMKRLSRTPRKDSWIGVLPPHYISLLENREIVLVGSDLPADNQKDFRE